MEKSENTYKYFIAMIIAMLLWGVAWTSGKVAAEHANAPVAAFWRYAISLLSLIPVIIYFQTSLKTSAKGYFYMFLAGLLTALFNYLFFKGLSHGQAGYGGTLVTALAPIFTYLMSIVIFKVQVTNRQIFALFIGAIGAVILLKIPFEGLGFLNADSLYFLECAIVWSLVTIFSQKASKRANAMFYTLVVFTVTCFVNMMFALPYHPFDFSAYDKLFWANIIFIGILPGTFSTTLFFLSAGKIGAHRTGVFMFIVPIGAIVSSQIVYGEKVAISTLIGCLLAFLAVFIFNKK
ncbi:MAG: DMT family transporter [Sulfurovaceae bacterium]|nr:DMT family transporter [Sulfurovaceae bacterium]MDD5549255.1 DMT family transporter [Sulfurovaceae bacterium]